MKQQVWHRRVTAILLAVVLAGCGGSDKGKDLEGGLNAGSNNANPSTAPIGASASSSELIESAQAKGEIDTQTALTYKVMALFRDPHLPAKYSNLVHEEYESDALEGVAADFNMLPPTVQRAIAPYLMRPAHLGSWAAQARTGTRGVGSPDAGPLESRPPCKGIAPGWVTAGPAGGSYVRVWYDAAVAGDRAIAVAVSHAIENEIWPRLKGRLGVSSPPNDASLDGCDGGDSHLDVYLVHGINARGLTVPEKTRRANQASVFTLLNADFVADAKVAAAQQVMNAFEYTQQVTSSRAPVSERRRALAVTGAAGTTATANASATATPVAPVVLQAKSTSLSSRALSITLDRAVTTGNWIAIAISTMGTTPRNVALVDNQGHVDLSFAAAASKNTNGFGTIWRYVKSTNTGPYTLSVDRGAATSGSVQVLEIGDVDPTKFLDISGIGASGTSAEASSTFLTTTTKSNDLLLSVIAVRSSAATLTPKAPAGMSLVESFQDGLASSAIFSFGASVTGIYRIAASISAANPWRMSSIAIRGQSGPVVAVPPANTTLPVIAVTDNSSYLALAVSQGTWTNSPTAYAYSWTRNGTMIPGATLATYNTTPADQGTSIAGVVSASNSAGSANATSVAVPVPFPASPNLPSIAFSASPPTIAQGQPSTLAWSSTNAISCAGSGAWSGPKNVSGATVVTPASDAAYTLDCVGTAGTAAATVSIQVTTAPPGSNPTLGVHGLVFHISRGSTGPSLSVPAKTTQSGSTILAFVGKGSIYNLSLPFDNKGNTPYVQLGAIHEYTRWPGEGTAMYAFNSVVGGPNHIVSVEDSNVWDEVTLSMVEVKNGGVIQDYKWNEVLHSATQTTQSVTTTGPATLIAVWYGDDSSSTPSNPVPSNGFTVIEGNGNATESVQMFVATKDVAAAGTYNVTWSTSPIQGAQLYLVAVQKR